MSLVQMWQFQMSIFCMNRKNGKCWTIHRSYDWFGESMTLGVNSAAHTFSENRFPLLSQSLFLFSFVYGSCCYCCLFVYNVIKTDFDFDWKMSDVLFSLGTIFFEDATKVTSKPWSENDFHFCAWWKKSDDTFGIHLNWQPSAFCQTLSL